MLEKFRDLVGDLGGYESDFLYMVSFISSFERQLKTPAWTFMSLRKALDSSKHDPLLRDIMRRCFALAGRPIIGGIDDPTDPRLDKAIVKLLADRSDEASLLFPGGTPDLTYGFLSMSVDSRARIIRFLMESVFESSSSSVASQPPEVTHLLGMDEEYRRYFLLKDSTLEVGCWRELTSSGLVELIATTTDGISNISVSLRKSVSVPDRARNMCTFCRKRVTEPSIACVGCSGGCCHYKCLPSDQLNGLQWACSNSCYQSHLATSLQTFVAEIEPLQKAEMRKRRRLQGELNSLRISGAGFEDSTADRRTTRGRSVSGVDYSFRDYDRLMREAIRKSEKKSDYTSSEEEAPLQRPRNMTREERMAMRERRQGEIPSYMPNYDQNESSSDGPSSETNYFEGAPMAEHIGLGVSFADEHPGGGGNRPGPIDTATSMDINQPDVGFAGNLSVNLNDT